MLKLAPDRAGAYAALAFALAAQKKIADLEATLAAAESRIPENLYPAYRAGNGLLTADAELPRAVSADPKLEPAQADLRRLQ